MEIKMKLSKSEVLFKFLKEDKSGIFSGSHDIHTPQPMVEELITAIPDIESNKTILVLFNVEFVISLVYNHNINTKNITFYSDNPIKTKFVNRMGVVNVITNLETTMKFDVVVGNPPYQDTGADRGKFNQLGNNKLYKRFMSKSSVLLADDGIIAFIVPSAILKTTVYGQPGQAISEMTGVKIAKIKTNVNEHFPMVGISICYFVGKRTESDINATVNDIPYDFNNIGYVAVDFELQSIANKLLIKNSDVTIERTSTPKAKKGFWTTRFAYLNPSSTKTDHELFWGHPSPKKLLRLVQSNLFARVSWDGFVMIDKRWYHNFWSSLYVHPDLTVNMTDDEIMDLYKLTEEEKETIKKIDRTNITKTRI